MGPVAAGPVREVAPLPPQRRRPGVAGGVLALVLLRGRTGAAVAGYDLPATHTHLVGRGQAVPPRLGALLGSTWRSSRSFLAWRLRVRSGWFGWVARAPGT
jgi:hypothetical protein